jgi:iron complex transport system ATP-binding protein
MAVLAIEGLSSAPYGSPLLQDIQLQLEAGEVLGLIGPNGSGKSSLLHTIAGGLPAPGESIKLRGCALQDRDPRDRARALSMQTQHASLNFPFTVEDVVLMGRIPHASGIDCDRHVLEDVLAATDTVLLRDRPYTQLSGGEKQRVQLARAVAQVWRAEDAPCRLLLLDEPSSALDLPHQRMVLDLVGTLSASGCAVIVSSHDFNLLAARCHHLLVLQDGHQHSIGSPAEVLTPAMFAEVFGADVLVEQHPRHDNPLVIPL